MSKEKWVDFWYRDFEDVPRLFWFIDHIIMYQFESSQDEKTMEFSRFYTVSTRDWNNYREIGACPTDSVKFDVTKRKSLDVSILEQLTLK